jgi:3'-5' exoribonuclease
MSQPSIPTVPSKQFFIADLKPQDTVRSTFLVKSKGVMQARNGKPYLAMILGDCTGSVDTRVWTDDAVQLADQFGEGDVIAIAGRAQWFQNRLQLVVDNLVPVEGPVAMVDYLPKADVDSQAKFEELKATFAGLECRWTRQLSLALLDNPEVASRYPLCPAAKTIHHAYLGGLLIHSLQLTKLVDAVLPYYPRLNRSILMFGAAFHDFGKIFELSYDGSFGYTDPGKLVGHITIGTILIDREIRKIPDFPEELEWQLKHMVLSHHGRLEYGSPVRPQTLEAQLMHHLDDMDSKLNSIQELMDADRGTSRWTPMHKAYESAYFKPKVSP